MSTFAVKVRKIDEVYDHPTGDVLSVAKVGGYECVVGRNQYKPGDAIIYVPEGAIVPDWILVRHNFWNRETNMGRLAGPQGNRVHPLRLRGIYSQGIVLPLIPVPIPEDADPTLLWELEGNPEYEFPLEGEGHSYYVTVGTDVAAKLGITKYEPEIPPENQGSVFNSFGVSLRYDFDSIQDQTDMFEPGEPVIGTEKIHGFNVQIGYVPGLNHEHCFGVTKSVYISSKLMAGKGMSFKKTKDDGEPNDNVYTRALNSILKQFEPNIAAFSMAICAGLPVRAFAEIYGAQDLKYGRNKKDVGIALFDVFVGETTNGLWLPYETVAMLAEQWGMDVVPKLYEGPFDADALRAVRDGKDSFSGKHIREGVVITGLDGGNNRHIRHGRKIVKWVSPDYGGRKGGTEFQ
jgi:RNA ligase (TIGR02306 family)